MSCCGNYTYIEDTSKCITLTILSAWSGCMFGPRNAHFIQNEFGWTIKMHPSKVLAYTARKLLLSKATTP